MSTPVATLLVSVILTFAVGIQGMVSKFPAFKVAFLVNAKTA